MQDNATAVQTMRRVFRGSGEREMNDWMRARCSCAGEDRNAEDYKAVKRMRKS